MPAQSVKLLVDLRIEKRQDVTEAATLRLLNPFCSQISPIRLTQRSGHGLRFTGDVSLPPGSLIQIRTKRELVIGEARYCRRSGFGFEIGVKIESIMPLKVES